MEKQQLIGAMEQQEKELRFRHLFLPGGTMIHQHPHSAADIMNLLLEQLP